MQFLSSSPWRQSEQKDDINFGRAIQDSDSPSRQRIKVLSEKWGNIRQGIDKDRNEKKELIELQINKIEQLIYQEKPKDDARFKSLKDNIIRLQDQTYGDKSEREVRIQKIFYNQKFEEKKQKDLKIFEETLMYSLEEERNVKILKLIISKNKRKVEMQLLKQIEDRFNSLNDNLEKNNMQYSEKINKNIEDISYSVSQLRFALESESQQREESQGNLSEQIDSQINKFQEMMLIEKQVREETQKKIFNMIEDIHARIQSELQNERKEREVTTNSLLKLLENTCFKIEDNFKR